MIREILAKEETLIEPPDRESNTSSPPSPSPSAPSSKSNFNIADAEATGENVRRIPHGTTGRPRVTAGMRSKQTVCMLSRGCKGDQDISAIVYLPLRRWR